MPRIYGHAETVEEIATRILPLYHSELATARIRYIFVDKASSRGGRPVLGKSKKVSGSLEFLIESDFLIEIALDCWNSASEAERTALVDHLLECCTGIEDEENGGAMKWTTREPDVREFSSILHRHGAWTKELAGLVDVAQRLNIDARLQEVSDSQVVQTQDMT
jgi:putative metallopeptidase